MQNETKELTQAALAVPDGAWITAQEAADLLGVHPRRAYQIAEEGAVPSKKVYGRLVMHRQSVETYKETLRPNKRRRSHPGALETAEVQEAPVAEKEKM